MDNGVQCPSGTFEMAMDVVQTCNIIGTRGDCHTMDVRVRMAQRELLGRDWGHVFNTSRIDGLILSDD